MTKITYEQEEKEKGMKIILFVNVTQETSKRSVKDIVIKQLLTKQNTRLVYCFMFYFQTSQPIFSRTLESQRKS